MSPSTAAPSRLAGDLLRPVMNAWLRTNRGHKPVFGITPGDLATNWIKPGEIKTVVVAHPVQDESMGCIMHASACIPHKKCEAASQTISMEPDAFCVTKAYEPAAESTALPRN